MSTTQIAQRKESAVRQRRTRAQVLGWTAAVGPPVVALVVAASRGQLSNLSHTGFAITRAESWWLAAWLLGAASIALSVILRRQSEVVDDRTEAHKKAANARQVLQQLPATATNTTTMTAALDTARTTSDALRQATAEERRSGLRGLIVGADGRVSTSKLQAVIWTYAVAYAFTDLGLLGWRIVVRDKTPALSAYHDGFIAFAQQALKPEYIAVLGIPVAAAVAAKAIVSNKTVAGTLSKTVSDEQGVLRGVAETVSDDDGSVDLSDFQYVLFTLITLVYFFAVFFQTTIHDPRQGLPDLPPTLLALSGVSASAYIAKKALAKGTVPFVGAATPRVVTLGATTSITVTGSGFLSVDSLTAQPTDQNSAQIGGISLPTSGWTNEKVVITLPADTAVLEKLGLAEGTVDLVISDDQGNSSSPLPIQLR